MSGRSPQRWWITPALFIILLALGLNYLPGLWAVRPAYLWTDRLVFFLVAMVALLIGYVRHKEHLRAPWARVFRRRLTIVAMIVLMVYSLIGLADSVHFRKPLPLHDEQQVVHYSVEVLSLLDVMLAPLMKQTEKTYSAPFAIQLYSKESVRLPDGTLQRVFPRLKYGGAHLKDPEHDRWRDIAYTSFVAALQGLLIWVLLSVTLAVYLARSHGQSIAMMIRNLLTAKTKPPWHIMLYTALVLIVLGTMVMHLSAKYHVLGTDKVGQDVLYQAVKSIRTGLVIGTLTTLVMLPFAIMLGIAAGYFKGWVDDIVQYLYTTLSSIPGVLLIAAAILSIQVYIANNPELFETGAERADLRLLALCFILGITSWTGLCRLLRGETLKLSEVDYIQAATAFGVRHFKIISRHILPNVMHIVLILVALDFSGLVLAEAVLSYVGVGVDPSTMSWGNMINGARLEMGREPVVWWSLMAAFLFMFTLVLAANLFADAVRDAFDPRLRAR